MQILAVFPDFFDGIIAPYIYKTMTPKQSVI